MSKMAALLMMLLVVCVATPVFAAEPLKPEAIAEKMAFKFVRGVTNFATAIVELPKQTYLTVRDRGKIGYAVGPIKGVGMTFYRGVMGIAEALFFVVPQPGYYDPMLDPVYVWEGWDEYRSDSRPSAIAESDVKGKQGE